MDVIQDCSICSYILKFFKSNEPPCSHTDHHSVSHQKMIVTLSDKYKEFAPDIKTTRTVKNLIRRRKV